MITVVSVTAGDYDLDTPEGRLVARITGSVARKESEDRARRVARKHREKAERLQDKLEAAAEAAIAEFEEELEAEQDGESA